MTLIVAKKFKYDDIHIFSDIKLSRDDGIYVPPQDGMLKTWMIQQDLAMSFAGRLNAAVEFKKEVDRQIPSGLTWENILSIAYNISKKWALFDSEGIDFIISSARNGGQIAKITSKGICDELIFAWIGERAAFGAYQANYLSDEGESITDQEERTKWAFDKFLTDGGTSTAGQFGFHVGIELDDKQRPYFNYRLGARTTPGIIPKVTQVKAGKPAKIAMGNAIDGTFSVSWVRSQPGKKTGAGLYFDEGKFGFFFCPAIGFNAITFNDVNVNQFLEKIYARLGVPVHGVFTSGTGFQYCKFPI